jgi:hypothetical protein
LRNRFAHPAGAEGTPGESLARMLTNSLAPEHAGHLIAPLLPLDRPSIGLKFAGADEHLVLIRRLAEPSVIGVASVSKTFLRTARGLLAPVTGRRLALLEFLLPLEPRWRIEARRPSILRFSGLAHGPLPLETSLPPARQPVPRKISRSQWYGRANLAHL